MSNPWGRTYENLHGTTRWGRTWDTDRHKTGICLLQKKKKCCRKPVDGQDTAGYPLVDTVILYNLRESGCASQECKALNVLVKNRRAAHLSGSEIRVWDD